jgi:hypothetical protein
VQVVTGKVQNIVSYVLMFLSRVGTMSNASIGVDDFCSAGICKQIALQEVNSGFFSIIHLTSFRKISV